MTEQRLPAQSRDQWVHEFRALLDEARQRGDQRPRAEILNEWLKFRKQSETVNILNP